MIDPVNEPLPGRLGVLEIAAGSRFTCAWRASGQVACCGEDEASQCGDGTTKDRPDPVAVEGVTSAVAIAAGAAHACALLTSGAVVCWGSNEVGQLGVACGGKRCGAVEVLLAPG